jgi:hypothetical protein
MSNETMQIHNVQTDEVIIYELTDEEQAQLDIERQAARDAKAAREAEKVEKTTQRTELLERLGITEEEAGLLLS